MKTQYIHFSLIDQEYTKPYKQFSERAFYRSVKESWVDEFGDCGGTEFVLCVRTAKRVTGLVADITCKELHFMMDGVNIVIHDTNGPSIFGAFGLEERNSFCLYGRQYSFDDFCKTANVPSKQKSLLKLKYDVSD